MKLFDSIKQGFMRIGIKKAKKNSNILKDALEHPEKMILTAYIDKDEIIIKVKRRKKQKKIES